MDPAFQLVGAATAFAVMIAYAAYAVFRSRSALKTPQAKALLAVAAAMALYAGTKPKVPSKQPADFRFAGQTATTEGFVNYYMYPGTEPTNLEVVVFGGTATNSLSFSLGEFYYEYQGTEAYRLWVRDSDTDDWIGSVGSDVSGNGWRGSVAKLLLSANPMSYRFWFIGPESNLPEKVTEAGVGIDIVRMVRDAYHIHIDFSTEDEDLAEAVFVLEARRVVDGVLLDWDTVATTTGRSFNVVGFFVDQYSELRIRADKEAK